MNNSEKYGIELEANYSKFKNDMNDASRIAKEFSDRMSELQKTASKTMPDPINNNRLRNKVREYETSIEHINKKIQEFKSRQTIDFNDLTGLQTVNDNLTERERAYLQKLQTTADNIERKKERIKKQLGEPFIEYDLTDEQFDKGQAERDDKAKQYFENIQQEAKQVGPIEIPVEINTDETKLSLISSELEQLKQKYIELRQNGLSEEDPQVLKTLLQIQRKKEEYDKLLNTIQEVNQEEEKTGDVAVVATGKMQVNFGGLFKTLKRFTLSLFGIHSIWRMISRASSEALATSDEQSAKLRVTWNALGQIMLPLIERLVNGFQYVAIFIAKVVQLLTGYNALAKVTTRNIKKAGDAAKNLTKSLGGFDEITNLDTASTNLALQNDLNALDDFIQKIAEVEEWMNRTGLTKFFEDLGKALRTFWENILKPMWDNVLYPMLSFIVSHPAVFETLFAIFLGTKLLKGIEAILGSAAAGTGLFGLHHVLGLLAAIGVISIVINVSKVVSAMDELSDAEETVKNNTTIFTQKTGEQFDKWKDNIQNNTGDVGKSFDAYLRQIGTNDKRTYRFAKNMSNYHTDWTEGAVDSIKGVLNIFGDYELTIDRYHDQLDESIGLHDKAVKGMMELYGAGKLTDEQIDRLKDSLYKNNDALLEMMSSANLTEDEMALLREEINKNNTAIATLNGDLDNADGNMCDLNEVLAVGKTKFDLYAEAARVSGEKSKDAGNKMTTLKDAINKIAEKTGISKDKIQELADKWKNLKFDPKTLSVSGDFTGFKNSIAGLVSEFTSKFGFPKTMANQILSTVFKKIGSFDVGTNYVPNDQLAMVHKGEAIIPKQFNKAEFFNNVNNDDVISAINDLKQTLIEKDMNAYIGEKEVGQASINYINNQNRIMGRSVV